MRPEFYEIYQRQYEDYLSDHTWRGEGLSNELVREMIYETRRAIDNAAEREGKYAVRPDAKYFLLVNFYEMVLRPIGLFLQKGGDADERFNRQMMRQDLKHDVETILDAAEEGQRVRGDKFRYLPEGESVERVREISGHNVIDAIGDAWGKIKYNEYLYWGRTDE